MFKKLIRMMVEEKEKKKLIKELLLIPPWNWLKFLVEEKEKKNLIKELAKKRIPVYAGINVDTLSDFDLLRLPEATIVTIVGTYCTIKELENLTEEKILEKLIVIRASIGDLGEQLPKEEVSNAVAALQSTFNLANIPLTLNNYIKYILEIENPHTSLPSPEQVDEAIEKAKKIYTR